MDANALVYLRARYYHPGLGVFTSLDPVEGDVAQTMSLNRYGYVSGNVVNAIDPSGMIWAFPDRWSGCNQQITENCTRTSYAVLQSSTSLSLIEPSFVRRKDGDHWFPVTIFPTPVENGDQILTGSFGGAILHHCSLRTGYTNEYGLTILPQNSIVMRERFEGLYHFWGFTVQGSDSSRFLDFAKGLPYGQLAQMIIPEKRPFGDIYMAPPFWGTRYWSVSPVVEAHLKPTPNLDVEVLQIEETGPSSWRSVTTLTPFDPYDKAWFFIAWVNLSRCDFNNTDKISLVANALGLAGLPTSAVTCAMDVGTKIGNYINEHPYDAYETAKNGADYLLGTVPSCLDDLVELVPGVTNIAAAYSIARTFQEACIAGYSGS